MENIQAQKPENIERQENNYCQQFFGPISNCVFIMPRRQDAESGEENISQEQRESNVDSAIKALFKENICDSPDWAAVVRLLQERGLKQPNGLLYDADYINNVCGQVVTNKQSIERAVMNYKIGGLYPNWYVRSGTESREMPKILALYNQIAGIVVSILDR